MSRTLARLALTSTTTLVLLVMAALPALAVEAATKPTPGENDYLIGSMPQLYTTMIVGLVLGALAFADRPKSATIDDEHAHDHS